MAKSSIMVEVVQNQTVPRLQVVPINEAWQIARKLNSQQNPDLEGITSLFEVIKNWTKRFSQSKVLPSKNHLMEETSFSEQKIDLFLLELLGYGAANSSSLIVGLPLLQLELSEVPSIKSTIVFVRPEYGKEWNIESYHREVIHQNVQSLEHWSKIRPIADSEQQAQTLQQSLQEDHIADSHMQTTILRMFQSDISIIDWKRSSIFECFVRPVIQVLLKKGVLILLQNTFQDKTIRRLYWKQDQEILSWYETLAKFYSSQILPDYASSSQTEISPEKLEPLPTHSMTPGFRQVVEELSVLHPFILPFQTRGKGTISPEEGKKLDNEMESAEGYLKKQTKAVSSHRFKFPAEVLEILKKEGNVFHTRYPMGRSVLSFYLHRERLQDAVSSAKRDFEKYGDDTQALILESMQVEHYMHKDILKVYTNLQRDVYYRLIPWYIRLFRRFFGQSLLLPKELIHVKEQFQSKLKTKIRIFETEQATVRVKKLAKQRFMEQQQKSNQTETDSSFSKKSHIYPQSTWSEKKNKDTTSQILNLIDQAWGAKLFPNRTLLLENISDFKTENEILFFLKKHCSRHIYSFYISSDKPEFTWPILISRRYLQKNGAKLLDQVQKDADKQRQAIMPDQEKFNIAVAIEDFLLKTIPKMLG